MLNGSFARFGEVDDLHRKLNNHTFEHDLEGETVEAVIQLDNTRQTINDMPIISGLVIDHKLIPTHRLEKEDGKYIIKTEISPRPVWANFQILGNGLVRVFSSIDRGIAQTVLSHALGGTVDFVKPVIFDLQKMYKDYKGHWIGSIFDREGNMQKGTFYGKDIEKDDVIGACWKANKKSIFGFETDYFGNQPVKVRVTLEGSVQVHSSITDQTFLQYVLSELTPYMLDPPRSRHRRTS